MTSTNRSHVNSYSALHVCPGGDGCDYTPSSKGLRPPHRPSGCDKAWKKYRMALYQSFRQANPDLKPDPKRGVGCPGYLDWSHRHHKRKLGRYVYGQPTTVERIDCQEDAEMHRCGLFDHYHGWAFHDQAPYRVIISHPYGAHDYGWPDWSKIKLPALLPEDITYLDAGTARSWYFPSHSNLVIVGDKHTLSLLNLDYDLPDPALRPIKCVRWRDDT